MEKGQRILLIKMVDPNPVPPNTMGTIRLIDDAKQLHINWDNGRNLAIVPEVDKFEVKMDKK